MLKDSVKKLENVSVPEGETHNPVNKTNYCFVHEDKELELYCETCGELICYKCAVISGKHHNHDHDEINVAFEKYKEEIKSSLEPIWRSK